MWVCLMIVPWEYYSGTRSDEVSIIGVILFQAYWMTIVLFSPLKQLTRRLGFVVLGVLTLVVLSEISKLNLHQYLPPKVSDNSLR
jgi:hypothetical protein